jgi:hypothetical protein
MTDPWKEFAVVIFFVFVNFAALYVLYAVICPAVWSV